MGHDAFLQVERSQKVFNYEYRDGGMSGRHILGCGTLDLTARWAGMMGRMQSCLFYSPIYIYDSGAF